MSIGRNEKCPCESGKKFKNCCIKDPNYIASELNNDIAKNIQMNFIDQYSKRFKINHSNRDLKEIVETRKGQFTPDEVERAKKIFDGNYQEEIEKEYIKNIINPFIETLPEKEKKIVKQVQIKILPTFEMNASAIKGPNGEFIIILHQQLITALGHYNEAQMICGQLKLSGANDQKIASFLVESHKEIIKCYKYKDYLPKFSQLPVILTRELYIASMEKSLIQELFLVAHEFAHIYLGHLSETEEKTIHFQGEENIQVEEYVKSQLQELEADALALKWIVNAFKKEKLTLLSNVANKNAPYYAVELFMFLHMIEVNTNRYANYNKNASLYKELTLSDISNRLIDITIELDKLVSDNLVGQNLKHPYASLRMLNVIAKTQSELDENEQKNLLEMLRDMLFYETFLVEQF